ncbi:hypothetical protein LOZ80_02895 [Paenibacillus sp. HWE-109]|uniref:hypothetical protein n=1 Tax=Paenibacillus sp. HWE-109 TaxID=1306526 RepID=UPI001EDE76E2|nr:hypothetical protein [Paenibacillus sp. HWE-109]UKS27915.1 hypothetical protein LOZ80_02895 [Paenibacillus sp. HWE-109]
MKARLPATELRTGKQRVEARTFRQSIWRRMMQDKHLYMMLLPVISFYLLFKFAPMIGEIIAFKNYRFADGVFGSQWVGFKHFQMIFASPDFWRILRNTLVLNLYSLVFGFPIPVVLALLLNEVRRKWYKSYKTIPYLMLRM